MDKKEVLILGAGRQGRTAGTFLKEKDISITAVDINSRNLKKSEEMGFSIMERNLSKKENVRRVMEEFSVCISALPAKYGRIIQECAVESRTNLIDLTYLEENPFGINRPAEKAGITVIPDAGIAPGISNVFCGHIYKEHNSLDKLWIFVGGIPEKRVPPLDYTVTWSTEDLISEYTREVRIKKEGEIVKVPPLSGVEDFKWEGVPGLEAFYTDGLRTLLTTMEDVDNMEEKTVRYSGHADKIMLLKEMGYFSEKCNNFNPREVTLCLLEKLKKNDIKDILLLRVIAEGEKNGRRHRTIVELFDRATDQNSAMERTTGYGCGILTYLLLENLSSLNKGILPPEELGMEEGFFEEVVSLLKEKNIQVEIKMQEL